MTRHPNGNLWEGQTQMAQAGFGLDWIRAVSEITQGQVIVLDGKILRRSHDNVLGKKAMVMVSAWATAKSLVLGQVAAKHVRHNYPRMDRRCGQHRSAETAC